MTRILYAEDDSLLRQAIKASFLSDGYDMVTTATPEEAIELLQGAYGTPDEFSVFVTDFDFGMLSYMKGHEAATLAKLATGDEIPVIIYSGMDRSHEADVVGAFFCNKMDIQGLRERVASLT